MLGKTPHNKGIKMSPERLELHKQAMKKLSQDPSWRQSIKNGIEKRSNNAQWRQSMKNFAKSKWKPILQYSLDGKFIARYDHAGLASIALRGNTSAKGNIRNCCVGRCHSVYGYIWKYENEESD